MHTNSLRIAFIIITVIVFLTIITASAKNNKSPPDLIWPVESKYYHITSGFRYRYSPVTKKWDMHTGIDIAVPLKQTVFASADGVVTFSGWKNGYSRIIIIRHKARLETVYCHLNRIYLKFGRAVRQRQVIALSGNSGRSTGPHLHFGIGKRGGNYVDPLSYLQKSSKI